MFYIKKRMEISSSHKLDLDYESKCTQLHGHNWIIDVYCKSEKLNKSGMVIDFSEIKNRIFKKLDHKYLNEILEFNTTAENLAFWIYQQIDSCYKVDVRETNGNTATYEE